MLPIKFEVDRPFISIVSDFFLDGIHGGQLGFWIVSI